MLVLSRARNEPIMIGDDIEVLIVAIRDNKVRSGVNAPKHIKVHRREIYDKIQQQKNAVEEAPDYKLPPTDRQVG